MTFNLDEYCMVFEKIWHVVHCSIMSTYHFIDNAWCKCFRICWWSATYLTKYRFTLHYDLEINTYNFILLQQQNTKSILFLIYNESIANINVWYKDGFQFFQYLDYKKMWQFTRYWLNLSLVTLSYHSNQVSW